MASAAGVAVLGVFDDAHAGNVVLGATAVEYVPAVEREAAEAAELLGQLTNWRSGNWSSRSCRKLQHRRLLSAKWAVPEQMSEIAIIITCAVRAVLLSLRILHHLAC